jgi:serine/threonine protein kinase
MTASDRPVFNDRYEIQQRIGRGGMADVFVARDRLLDRPVAIKVLFPEFATDPNFVERFRREAQSAANLNHPNIVGVYDWGREANTYFMAMEYVNGRTLADILMLDVHDFKTNRSKVLFSDRFRPFEHDTTEQSAIGVFVEPPDEFFGVFIIAIRLTISI